MLNQWKDILSTRNSGMNELSFSQLVFVNHKIYDNFVFPTVCNLLK